MSGKPVHRQLDPTDIGITIAVRRTGFSDEDIICVLAYMPNLKITGDELEAAVATEYADDLEF